MTFNKNNSTADAATATTAVTDGPVLYILYGSATGNSEQIAKDLASRVIPSSQLLSTTTTTTVAPNATPSFVAVKCEPMQNYKKYWDIWQQDPSLSSSPSNSSSSIVQKYHALLLITSTTGNGDPPENASRLIRFLKRQKPVPQTSSSSSPFSYLAYSVLGLGDSNYDKFNATSKLVDSKLHDLGAIRMQPLALADEATGLEDVVEPWLATILPQTTTFCLQQQPSQQQQQQQEEDNDNNPTKEDVIVKKDNDATITDHAIDPTQEEPTNNGLTTELLSSSVSSPKAPDLTMPSFATTITVHTNNVTPEKKNNINNNNLPSPTLLLPSSASSSSSPLYIMYGSATGNCEHIAKDLAAKFQSLLSSSSSYYFPSVVCCPLDQYKKHLKVWQQPQEPSSPLQSKHGLIIVTSTTGNGDAPENANAFCRFLKRKTTFGATAKLVDRKLHELGGTRAQQVQVADEATGLEDVVEPWTQNIFATIIHAARGDGGDHQPTPAATTTTVVPAAPEPVVSVIANVTPSTPKQQQQQPVVTDSATTNDTGKRHEGGESESCHGVTIVRALLSQFCDASTTLPAPPPNITESDLRSLGPCLSTCQWLSSGEDDEEDEVYQRHRRMSEADERMSFTTASSTAIYYTIHRPYESTILHARYLTRTNTDNMTLDPLTPNGNSDDCVDGTLQQLLRIYEKQFPLQATSESSTTPSSELEDRNGKRVIELRLSLPDDYTLEYQPGDSLGLVVDNTVQAVQFVLRLLQEKHGVKSTQLVSIDGKGAITVEEVIRSQVDLCSPLKNKRILLYLSTLATNPDEQSTLRLLASKTKSGEDLFRMFVEEQRRSFLDLLQDFPSCCQGITLEGLLSVLPGIPARYYSVSSSPLDRWHSDDDDEADKIHNDDGFGESTMSLTIAFSVVDYLTPSLRVGDVEYGRRRIGGVATRYLEAISTPWLTAATHKKKSDICNHLLPTTLKIFPKPSAEFRMPSNLSTPMILIGPGTGIAPFMGFLAHRQAQLSHWESTEAASAIVEGTWRGGYEMEADELPVSGRDARGLALGADYRSHQHVGSVDVFFGCRHADHDWLYREEMQEYYKRGILQELYTAFSRDAATITTTTAAATTTTPCNRTYVQDLMRQDTTAQRLIQLILEENASVYLCGDGNEMAKDVQATLIDLMAKSRFAGSQEEAKVYLETMKKEKRFLMDIWTS